MTRFFELVIALLIVAALLVIVGLFLPSSRTLEYSTETNHPIRQVYDTLNGFQRFRDWHPLRLHDPQISYQLTGAAQGKGARLQYESSQPGIGSGSWEIVDSAEDSAVVIAVENPGYGRDKTYRFDITKTGKTVTLTETYSVDYGWDLAGRFAGLYLERSVGDDMKIGLNNLNQLIATMPNFDYSVLTVQKVRLDPHNIIYAPTTSERNITAVQTAMDVALRNVRQAIAANNWVEAGPPRLITTDFAAETYEFDVAIPVRPKTAEDTTSAAVAGTVTTEAETATSTPAGEPTTNTLAGEGADPCAVPPLPAPEMTAPANLPDNVKFGQSYGGCALTTDYHGHPAALPLVRDMLRAYAAPRGLVVQDRAFEEYLDPFEEVMVAEASDFRVYWPIK